jgi:hypothetical protein
MEERRMSKVFAAMAVCLALVMSGGCSSTGGTGSTGMNKAEIGGLGGPGIGALLGQVIGGSTAGTLIGAGVGAGLGYIIGNKAAGRAPC